MTTAWSREKPCSTTGNTTRVAPVRGPQHHPEERRFEHKGGEPFIAEQRALDRSGAPRQHTPISAELERHDDAADHAHPKRKDLEPEVEHAPVDRVAGRQPHSFDRSQPGGEADCEGGKDNVEADNEGKLDTRQKNGIKFHPQAPRGKVTDLSPGPAGDTGAPRLCATGRSS